MTNPWVEFVKDWATAKRISYGCALTDPRIKQQYKRKKAGEAVIYRTMDEIEKMREVAAKQVREDNKKQEAKTRAYYFPSNKKKGNKNKIAHSFLKSFNKVYD